MKLQYDINNFFIVKYFEEIQEMVSHVIVIIVISI